MQTDEKILTGDYLGKEILVPYYAAATTGSFRGNLKKGKAIVREVEKIKVFRDLSLKIKDPVMFDIGACYGTYSYITLFNSNLKVQSFEPYPKMNEYIKDIIQLNSIPNITVNEFGLSDKERNCDMVFGSHINRGDLKFNVGTTKIKPEIDGDFQFKTLDSLNIQKMDLVKIDVEGHEMEVLEGAAETLKRCKPLFLQIEIHNHDKKRKEKLNKILKTYLNDEYKISRNFYKFHGDFFFKRKDAF